MMKKVLLIFILLMIMFSLQAENYLRYTISSTVLVFDPEKTQETILSWLTANGGYYLVRSGSYLSMRFPTGKVAEFNKLLENLGEEIQDIQQTAEDLQEQIMAAKSGIKSREDMLAQTLKLLDRADVEGTLGIEKEVTLLISEIEQLKGQLRKLETERAFAYGEIYFSFKQSSMPADIPSSFGWLNTLDLYSFKQEGF